MQSVCRTWERRWATQLPTTTSTRRAQGASLHRTARATDSGTEGETSRVSHRFKGAPRQVCVQSARMITNLSGFSFRVVVSWKVVSIGGNRATARLRIQTASQVVKDQEKCKPSLHWHELRFAALRTPTSRLVFAGQASQDVPAGDS
jgi:hypothetical protein